MKTVSFSDKQIFLMFGPLNSGKGTQGKKLAEELKIPHISTGDILRDNVKKQTELGKLADGYMKSGKLVPDDLIIDLIKNRIKEADCAKGFILDGFPRTSAQAKAFQTMMENEKLQISNIFLFLINEDLAIKRATGRWECSVCHTDLNTAYDPAFAKAVEEAEKKGEKVYHNRNGCTGEMKHRADDSSIDAIKSRYKDFVVNSKPAYDILSNKYPHLVIDGSKSKEEIFNEVMKSSRQ